MSDQSLENLLRRAKSRDVPLSSVLDALRQTELILPVQEMESDELSILVKNLGGCSYVTAYTSIGQLNRAVSPGPHIRVVGSQIGSRVPPDMGLAINPDDVDTTLAIPAEALVEMTGLAGTMAVGAPAAEVPVEVSDAVARLLAITTGVVEGYVFQTHDGRRPTLSVGLVLSDSADPSTTKSFAEALATRIAGDVDLQVITLQPELLDVVRRYCKPLTPLSRRRTW